ncbi:winged helix-turn-helix domain-containing protein [Streptomyces nanshensis]|uniref:ArsR family transcriptional regulator n=1 Tax=Streptomyces nanshensis TaxID=518642 RepID=A0A1E7L2K5_9ACTN|nr:helix-turn-helix domain-containing protein [Streptomyces nanshensis]OEV10425.1 ArsR family transcriptional regulator [Streptomyces nanshensis]
MTGSSEPSHEPGTEPDLRLDTARLRLLAHPVRVNVLTLLRQHGTSTAGRIAAELGINPGSASYHLRRLAAGGLIVEEPGRGSGRERWWTSVHRQSVHDPADESAEQSADRRAAGRAYAHAVALACVERLERAAQELPLLPARWYEAVFYGDFVLHLAPDEVERMRAELFEVVSRYRADSADRAERAGETEAPASRVPVSVQLQAFPVPGTVELGTEDA